MNRANRQAWRMGMLVMAAVLVSGLPARADDGPPRTTRNGWALLEIPRQTGADGAAWERAVATEAEKICQTLVLDGSALHKDLQAVAPGASANELNDRLGRTLVARVIPGTALVQVHVAMNDDSVASAKATIAVVQEYLRGIKMVDETQRMVVRVVALPPIK